MSRLPVKGARAASNSSINLTVIFGRPQMIRHSSLHRRCHAQGFVNPHKVIPERIHDLASRRGQSGRDFFNLKKARSPGRSSCQKECIWTGWRIQRAAGSESTPRDRHTSDSSARDGYPLRRHHVSREHVDPDGADRARLPGWSAGAGGNRHAIQRVGGGRIDALGLLPAALFNSNRCADAAAARDRRNRWCTFDHDSNSCAPADADLFVPQTARPER
jgi:hypothetical protein